jgi:hypothetical protein
VASISDLADAVTATSIGVLALSAAVVVVVAIVNTGRARRREQIVLAEVGELALPGGESHSAAPGLSPWLRQRVRNALRQQRHNARNLSETVLSGESATGASTFALPVELTVPGAEATIIGAAQDSLDALTQGIQAAARQKADGRALSALLPPPKGYLVRTMPMARGAETNPRLGLSVEVAQLDGPPIAACTFWEPEAGRLDEVQERLLDLIEPVARWIAIRLIAARSQVRSGAGGARMPAGAAFHQLLVGSLSRTAMDDFDDHATTFAEDAGEELRSAAEVLRNYYRPWEMLAGIQEELGRNFNRRERRDDAEAAFRAAQLAWRRAEKLLADRARPPADALERLRVRRLKCQVLANRTEGRPLVVQELSARPLALEPMQMRTLYNTACLYATLAGEFMDDARDAVGRTVLAEPTQDVRTYALRDPELLAIPGLATFLDRLVSLRGQATEPILGDEAAGLIKKAKE